MLPQTVALAMEAGLPQTQRGGAGAAIMTRDLPIPYVAGGTQAADSHWLRETNTQRARALPKRSNYLGGNSKGSTHKAPREPTHQASKSTEEFDTPRTPRTNAPITKSAGSSTHHTPRTGGAPSTPRTNTRSTKSTSELKNPEESGARLDHIRLGLRHSGSDRANAST